MSLKRNPIFKSLNQNTGQYFPSIFLLGLLTYTSHLKFYLIIQLHESIFLKVKTVLEKNTVISSPFEL